MSVPICHHLKEDGVYCGSPSLKGRDYCYFHLNLRGRRAAIAQARRRGDNPSLNLPFPEDMHAVQVCLAEVMWAIAEDRIETHKAWAILNSLQTASANLNHTPNWQGEREAVNDHRPLRALSDPKFEQRHGLPENTDLDTENVSVCHPERGRREQSPSESKSRRSAGVGAGSRDPERAQRVEGALLPANDAAINACHSERSRLPLAAESKNPFPANDAAITACHPERSEAESRDPFPANDAFSADAPPDFIPFPEDEMSQLGMTQLDELEFFVTGKSQQDSLTEDEEHELLIKFLRARRAEEAADPVLAEERRQANERIAAHLDCKKAEQEAEENQICVCDENEAA